MLYTISTISPRNKTVYLECITEDDCWNTGAEFSMHWSDDIEDCIPVDETYLHRVLVEARRLGWNVTVTALPL